MRTTVKKISTVSLALAMVIMFIPAMSQTAYAADTNSTPSSSGICAAHDSSDGLTGNAAHTIASLGSAPEKTAIKLIDIGNIWKDIDYGKAVPFTTEVHPGTYDDNGSLLTNQMEITDERWISTDGESTLVKGEENQSTEKAAAGKTYEYQLTLVAKTGFYFADGFKFVNGGATPTDYDAVISDSGDSITIKPGVTALSRIDISEATVTGIAAKTYTGSALTQNPVVKVGDITLKSDSDYTLSYKSNRDAGMATVTITGVGSCFGAITRSFAINKANNAISVSTSAVSKTGSVSRAQAFTRAAMATSGVVNYASSQPKYVKVSTAGKVTVAKNWTGTAKITITSPATANYEAATPKTYTVKVKPGKMSVKSVANVKGNKIKVAWAKMIGADKYQIRVAQNSKMTKGKKTYTVKGAAAAMATGKLTKGKTYYVQIRAYDTQTKSWGNNWSTAKKAKVTK